MLVSIKWLKDYVDIEITAAELADKLTMAGLEVDEIKIVQPSFSGVVVSRIISVKPHPNSEKLSLCEVTDGSANYQVVCGAKNIQAGNIVPMARVGATIPGGYTIKSSVLRGEKSDGMLCSAAELEIGEDNSGIMQLTAGLPIGASLDAALDITDTVLDVGITPNRSDCLSIIGIAREVAAITGKKLKMPLSSFQETAEDINSFTSVEIIDAELCPRYTARMIKNVKIGQSPVWMKTRLEAVGLRSINNVVDVTNFVMLEMGQPLHAFDFRFLEQSRIIVRKSRQDEEFISLDGKSRKLAADTLLICDAVKPVAIGGIMGGLNSEVKEDTQVVLLESAYFNPVSIRRSARKLTMSTDAAYRFERGIDPEGVLRALDRAAYLIAELSGGNICKNYIDQYPRRIASVQNIPLRLSRVNQVIGADIKGKEIVSLLKSIEMKVSETGEGVYEVTPPTFRVDITREIDLIEEIVRLYGYDRVSVTLPNVAVTEIKSGGLADLEEKVRQLLTGTGYSEVINYSFTTPVSADILGWKKDDERRRFLKIRNPLVEDQSVMRTTMIYGLLDTLKKNINNGSSDLKLFEIGRIFISKGSTQLPDERNMMAGLLSGVLNDDLWGAKTGTDFYDLKGCVENLFYGLKIKNCRYVSAVNETSLHPGKSCEIYAGDTKIGFMGEVHPDVCVKYDIKTSVYVFEISLDILAGCYNSAITCSEVSKYPAVTRDVAFLIDRKIEAQSVLDIVLQNNEDLLEKIGIFDIYSGKGIPTDTKSLGLRFSYRAPDRTLTDAEVNNIHEKLVRQTVQLTGAKIRGE